LVADQVDKTGVAVYFIASVLRGLVAVSVAITVKVFDAADALDVNVVAEHVFFGFLFSYNDNIYRRSGCRNSSRGGGRSCSGSRSGTFRSTT